MENANIQIVTSVILDTKVVINGRNEVKSRRMTNLEAIRQMNLKELAYFLSVIKWDDLNSIHMIPKEDIDYFTEYLNKDGSELIESVKYCMEDWKKYMESEDKE